MARPVNADSAVTRQRILESALELFAQRGLDGVSIRSIAARSGVSLAMVHHYFGSKEELGRHCVHAMTEELMSVRVRFMEVLVATEPGDTGETISRLVRAAFRFAREHQVSLRLLLRQVMEAGELDEDRRRRLRLPFLDEASEVLAAAVGRPAGELRLPLQSIVFLIARYGTCSLRELEQSAGTAGDHALRAVEDHLTRAAEMLLAS